MRILVLNSGSSSIKFSVYVCSADESTDVVPKKESEGQLSGIGSDAAMLRAFGQEGCYVEAKSLSQAIQVVLDGLSKSLVPMIDAVGYRVVHPGAKLHEHQLITPEVLQLLEEAREFAPLHDPEAVMLIRATMERCPKAAHYACFDTVFHQTMPAEAQLYPLPEVYRESGVHRYGFHGLSCESIVRRMAASDTLPRRMVIAHLGSGCSVTAVVDGRSVDNTMGLTPTGGVLMGTRSGDLDPGLVIYLMRKQPGSAKEAATAVETLLNHGSGVSVLSGLANDMQVVRAAASAGDRQARLALKVFTRSITKVIGGFYWLLGGLDAIVFTGGIGEHDVETRNEVLASVSPLADTQVLVVPAEEDLMIAVHVQRMACAAQQVYPANQPTA
jgi:acetate kinase